jgi:adenylate kinase family enzyme
VERVVVLGNGASGKSRFARELSEATGIARTDLDSIFWSPDLVATPQDEWRQIQDELVQRDRWILDGDLGPYDALDVRLSRADTIVLFDLPTVMCAWRAVRRSRERVDFWRWLFSWRRRFRPNILGAIKEHAPNAELLVVRSRGDRNRVLAHLSRRGSAG